MDVEEFLLESEAAYQLRAVVLQLSLEGKVGDEIPLDYIDEIEGEEKQLKGLIYKQEFELTEKREEKIDLTQLKHQFISFKTNYDTFSHDQLKDYLISQIDRIYFTKQKLRIKFRSIPWYLDFESEKATTKNGNE